MRSFAVSRAYTETDLNSLTIAEIKAIAAEEGYSITQTRKADIIAEILAQQEGHNA